jgi:hypothetical protein
MHVRLIRKLADQLDGVDVSQHREGDVVDLPVHDAALLLAEGWAVPAAPRTPRRTTIRHRHPVPSSIVHAEAADSTNQRTIERLRELRREMEQRELDRQESRRAEDLIREELHDSRAKTVPPEG